MSPQHLAERRALYAAIDSAADRHLRARTADPRIHHSPKTTAGMSLDFLWWRDRLTHGPAWRITTVVIPDHATRKAVIDDFGNLVEVVR